ncbi:hypothetical protein [Fodinibius sp.]|uniref:hypothetical protein n=1 Tax=Fodinibius sp. TaxID=1872440 RepID=UPI003A1004E9
MEDIEIGDKVLTHKDRFKPSNSSLSKNHSGWHSSEATFPSGKSQPKEVNDTRPSCIN